MSNPFNNGFCGNACSACFAKRPDSKIADQADMLTAEEYIAEQFPHYRLEQSDGGMFAEKS